MADSELHSEGKLHEEGTSCEGTSHDGDNIHAEAELHETGTIVNHDLQNKTEEKDKDTYLHGAKLAIVFLGLGLAMFVMVLDQTIILPAIPVIASDFDAVNEIGWISSSYFLTQCSSIFLWGQILAFYGQKIPLLVAIAIFEVGSLIAAVAHNFITFIVGRAVAGIGAAAIGVAIFSISAVIVELKRRPVFFGLFGLIFVIGSSFGPLIGGSLTSNTTWRWCFYLNLPIGGVSMVAVAFCIPRIKPRPRSGNSTAPNLVSALRRIFGDHPVLKDGGTLSKICALDWIGSLLVLGGMTSLTLALISGGSAGWDTATVIAGFTCSGVALILLLLWEILVMRDEGMIPLRIARFRSLWGSAGVAFTRMVTVISTMSYLPTFMQATRHQSAINSAISTLPYSIGMAVFAIVGSVVVQKTGRLKWALCFGPAVSAVGAGLLFTISANTSYAKIAGFQVIGSLGVGLVMMNAILAAQAELHENGLVADIPQASALVAFTQLLGGSLGGSIGGALLTSGLRRYLPSDLPSSTTDALLQSVDTIWTLSGATQESAIEAYARALDNVFITGAACGALGFFFALICRNINIKGKNFRK
ncbi:major facilitator superfamily domain-containing protein [Naematelia encephala]|uniref:Major facilitator superfamily domain-containing protein n=1 Tax=Naematelia encephala TaxID=71784 RepID=A0A1Y2B2A1_9TREE|nr:major facilitator superfamily domain-containing protein [Naematelia encephala]